MRERPDPAELRARLSGLLAAHAEIDFAYLFGSFADGLPYHDVDVAVFLRPAPAPSKTLDCEMDLSVELTLALHTDVDVYALNGAPLGLQHSVLRGEPLLVRDEERLTDFVEKGGRSWSSPTTPTPICALSATSSANPSDTTGVLSCHALTGGL